jgi:hypothetical protein
MDTARFLELLNSNALFFPRADTLGDPFEGARGLASRRDEWRHHYLEFFRNSVLSPPGGATPPAPEEAEKQAERLYADFMRWGELELRNTYVSCWHVNEGESEAQWRLYTPTAHAGIAIRTTFGRLDKALDQTFDVRAGYVQYVNFNTAFAGVYDRIYWKRASLKHEAELRLVLKQFPERTDTPLGISVSLNLAEAIEAVVMSPFAPPWVENVLRQTIGRFGQAIPVESSTLLEQPFF